MMFLCPLRTLLLCWDGGIKGDAPFGFQELRLEIALTSVAGPLHEFAVSGGTRAEKALGGLNACAEEVQAVGVPADSDREISRDGAVGVGLAGFYKKGEAFFIKLKKALVVELLGQLCATVAVTGVPAFVFSAGIVEDGKELNHGEVGSGALGQNAAIFQNTGPMGQAMPSVKGLLVLGDDGVDKWFCDGRHSA